MHPLAPLFFALLAPSPTGLSLRQTASMCVLAQELRMLQMENEATDQALQQHRAMATRLEVELAALKE